MKSRAQQLLNKSIDAMLSAIEIYNKPSFAYREESFAILAINSWELLLKARILQIDGNRLSSIIEYEQRRRQDGTMSIMLYRKRNRSGNNASIGLFKAFDRLINEYNDTIDTVVRKNLEALKEIRDNAVHFMHKDVEFKKKIYEIGTASLKNYLYLARQWFGVDLNEYQLFLMPIAFFQNITKDIVGLSMNRQEKNLLNYIKELEKSVDDDVSKDINFSLDIDIHFRRVSDPKAAKVIVTKEKGAIPVTLSEEDIRQIFPWDYRILTNRLRKRYKNFILNSNYHLIRKDLEKDPSYCKERYLDPGNPKSSKKKFYSPNILKEFDKHYKSKKS